MSSATRLISPSSTSTPSPVNTKTLTNPWRTAPKSSFMDVPGRDSPSMRVTATLPPRFSSSHSPSTTFTNRDARCSGVLNTQELYCLLISAAAGVEILAELLSAGVQIPISWDLELIMPPDTFARILAVGTRLLLGSPPFCMSETACTSPLTRCVDSPSWEPTLVPEYVTTP